MNAGSALGAIGFAFLLVGGAVAWTVLDAKPALPPLDASEAGHAHDGSGTQGVPAELETQGLRPEPAAPPPPPPQEDDAPPPVAAEGNASAPAPSPPDPAVASPDPPATELFAEAKAAARALHCKTPGWPCRTFEWSFGAGHYWLVLELDPALYQAYRAEAKPTRVLASGDTYLAEPAYDLYVSDPRDDPFVDFVAKELRRMAASAGLDAREELSFALAFVQGLTYTPDAVSTGFDEYPRYPLETLVDDGGDCEDTSILYASLALALGHGAVLLSPPRHMGVGVASTSPDGVGIDVRGMRYLYAETTGTGWALGDVPEEFQGTAMASWSLEPAPLFALHDTSVRSEGSGLRVETRVVNEGSGVAEGVVVAAVKGSTGTVHATATCPVPALPRRASMACDMLVDLAEVPRGVQVRLEVRAQGPGGLYDVLATNDFTL